MEIARQSSAKYHTAILIACDATLKYVYPIRQKMNVSICQAISALEARHSHACAACDNSVIRYIRISPLNRHHICYLQSTLCC